MEQSRPDTYPWLSRVEVNTLDPIGPGKQLFLKLNVNHG
jgi:hypothetical protein